MCADRFELPRSILRSAVSPLYFLPETWDPSTKYKPRWAGLLAANLGSRIIINSLCLKDNGIFWMLIDISRMFITSICNCSEFSSLIYNDAKGKARGPVSLRINFSCPVSSQLPGSLVISKQRVNTRYSEEIWWRNLKTISYLIDIVFRFHVECWLLTVDCWHVI